jgi:hypothetical protein
MDADAGEVGHRDLFLVLAAAILRAQVHTNTVRLPLLQWTDSRNQN